MIDVVVSIHYELCAGLSRIPRTTCHQMTHQHASLVNTDVLGLLLLSRIDVVQKLQNMGWRFRPSKLCPSYDNTTGSTDRFNTVDLGSSEVGVAIIRILRSLCIVWLMLSYSGGVPRKSLVLRPLQYPSNIKHRLSTKANKMRKPPLPVLMTGLNPLYFVLSASLDSALMAVHGFMLNTEDSSLLICKFSIAVVKSANLEKFQLKNNLRM